MPSGRNLTFGSHQLGSAESARIVDCVPSAVIGGFRRECPLGAQTTGCSAAVEGSFVPEAEVRWWQASPLNVEPTANQLPLSGSSQRRGSIWIDKVIGRLSASVTGTAASPIKLDTGDAIAVSNQPENAARSGHNYRMTRPPCARAGRRG